MNSENVDTEPSLQMPFFIGEGGGGGTVHSKLARIIQRSFNYCLKMVSLIYFTVSEINILIKFR